MMGFVTKVLFHVIDFYLLIFSSQILIRGHVRWSVGLAIAHLKNRKSHEVVTQALDMLARMEHRGGQGCDPCSGDGAGILLQKPHEFLLEEAVKLGIKLPSFEKYGVGVVLFQKDEYKREQCRDILERNAQRLDLEVIGYRVLPTDNSMIGADPLSTEPQFEHVFIVHNFTNCA